MRQSVLLFLLVLMVGCAAKLPVSLVWEENKVSS